MRNYINQCIEFDEKLKIAKALIDKCINKWSQEGANPNLTAIVKDAFNVEKTGNVSIPRILNLRKLNINDEDWQKAMQAITDSLMVTGSKSYMRFYIRKDEYEAWQHLSLDLASLEITN